MKSASDSINWLRSILLCCFFFRIETILKSTAELSNGVIQRKTKKTENECCTKWFSRISFDCFWKQLVIVLFFFQLLFYFFGQFLVVSSPLTLGLASNQSTSFHDLTTATITATMAKKTLKGNFRDYMTSGYK